MVTLRLSFFSVFVVIALTLPLFAQAADPCAQEAIAQGKFVPLACYKNTPLDNVYDSNASLPKYIGSLFAIALSAGAILAVIRLVWAGYHYMGSDMWSSKDKAKTIINDVIWGMLLLLGTYLILYQINPCILNLDILQSFGNGQTCSYVNGG